MSQYPNPCPCGSGQAYNDCCQVYHKGKWPLNALLLMRSRYSAYALNLPDYIIKTTHPASTQYSDNKFSWKRSLSQFSKATVFQQLDILDFKENGSMAMVVFTAHLLQAGNDATFTEKSFFEKREDRWYYRGGQLYEGHAPNIVTIGQLRLLPLAYYGDPILRKKADSVHEINHELKMLVEEMIETMHASNGIGLAAPQIHHSLRLFVAKPPVELENDTFSKGEVEVYINPQLSLPSDETVILSEGCLSIPAIRGEVPRPRQITIDYMNLEGKRISKRVDGWEARVIMHEYDHIEGILFIDHLSPKERKKIDPLLKNLERRIHDGLSL